MKILAIETSCDETACAVVEDMPAGRQVELKIISNIIASSKNMHEKYGGIVPEIAAREQLKCIIPVITEAMELLDRPAKRDSRETHETIQAFPANEAKYQTVLGEVIKRSIDAIAVTVGPGLIGSLLVGVETAKTIAFVTGKPIIPVNHVIAHMYANLVNSSQFIVQSKTQRSHEPSTINHKPIAFPAISLVVSGGHTELYLMKSNKNLTWLGGTLDDAAGECFDKTARLLGFGYGGGVAIQEAAKKCQMTNAKCQIKLPRPMINDQTLNFSFSGLKTAVMREWKKCSLPVIPAQAGIQFSENTRSPIESGMTNMFAYEIQEAIADVLVEKTLRAARQYNAKSILLSGGVAANSRLREKLLTKLQTKDAAKLSFYAPSSALCTDNAVMIGSYAYFRGQQTDWQKITAQPDLSVELIR